MTKLRKRRNRKKILGNSSIIYITTIIALSFMGVGYAAWSSGLNLDIDLTTGYIQGRIKEINNRDLNLEDGEWISFRFSDDNQTLYIDGEVYPTFNENIPLKIANEGSIPIKISDIASTHDRDITELKEETRGKYSRRSYIDEDVVECFQLNIKPDNDRENDHSRMQRDSIEEQDEISNLQDKIDQYNTKQEYEFIYEFLLEQSL